MLPNSGVQLSSNRVVHIQSLRETQLSELSRDPLQTWG